MTTTLIFPSIFIMAHADTPALLYLSNGVLIGFGLSGCSFNLVIVCSFRPCRVRSPGAGSRADRARGRIAATRRRVSLTGAMLLIGRGLPALVGGALLLSLAKTGGQKAGEQCARDD